MGVGPQSQRVYRFGVFELDFDAAELRKHGTRIRLRRKAFQALTMLVGRPGELVAREEFREQLWAGTFVEFEDNLNHIIKLLRDTLGDSAETPRFIETAPGRGYRFIAPVEVPAMTERSIETLPRRGYRPVRRWGVGIGIAVAVSLVAGYMTKQYFRPQAALPDGKIMLAVLPFDNMTGDPEQDFFSDGLTEEMISQLGRLNPERLGVIARTSAMKYRNGSATIGQIGRDLGLDYVLEGSVRSDGNRVRISAQLIEVRDETHVWAHDYDEDLLDILTLQGEVAQAVAREIRVTLIPREQSRLASGREINPEAHADYLRGRYLWRKRTKGTVEKAIEYFEKSISKDPGYAPAYAGLSDAYAVLQNYGERPVQEVLPKARAAALQALKIDDTLSEAHTSMGHVRAVLDWDWQGAERSFRRAIELNPSNATARHWYAGFCLAPRRRFEEALKETKLAAETDPLSPTITTYLGRLWHALGDHDRAIEQYRKVLAVEPNYYTAHAHLGLAYLAKSMPEQAIQSLLKARIISRDQPQMVARLAHGYGLTGRRQQALELLEELKRRAKNEHVGAFGFALIYMGLGDKDQTFRWLTKAADERSIHLVGLREKPIFGSLRSDPRFADLLARVKLID